MNVNPSPGVTGSAARFTRFDRSQRIEHLVLVISFSMLVLTGLPQRYASSDWAAFIIVLMGGIDWIRHIHRFFAVIFMVQSVYHILYVGWSFFVKKRPLSMLPKWKDVKDVVGQFRYYLGFSPAEPRYDRFDYRQKFEYWGVVWGGVVMIVTGLMLMFPEATTVWLPGVAIPAAREAHGGEALLAFLVIITWHLYGAHLNPHRFPADLTIFTGRISRERMEDEHPLELERLLAEEPATPEDEDEDAEDEDPSRAG